MSSRTRAVFAVRLRAVTPVVPLSGDAQSRERRRRESVPCTRQWLDEHGAARPHRRARRLAALRPSTRGACSRGLTGRWPSRSGSALLAMAEVPIYADAIGPAMIANLLATLPLAAGAQARRVGDRSHRLRRPPAIAADGATLTLAALVVSSSSLYLFASHLPAALVSPSRVPVPPHAIEPFSGDGAGFPGVLLLMVVVRQRRSVTRAGSGVRRSPNATRHGKRWSTRFRTRPRWRSAPGSRASCTTSSRTTSR